MLPVYVLPAAGKTKLKRNVSNIKMKIKTLIYVVVPIALVLLIILAIKLTGKKYYESKDYTWHAEIGSKNGDFLVRGKKIDKIRDDVNKLVYAINKSDKDPETFRTPEDKEPIDPPKLKLIDIKGEVVSVEVVNSEYLTQRMGSTGADIFLAEATFTLTEYNNIKFINFVFEQGDHASPGLYARKDFFDRWKPIEK